MKPTQATPELSGEDAIKLINQVNIAPTKKAIKRNKILSIILCDIRK